MKRILSPKEIAAIGQQIYHDTLAAEYEPEHTGKYLAINVATYEAIMDATPEGAIMRAKQSDPDGLFHLVRIGHSGVFQVGHSRATHPSWIFG
jgi:hypothetical protein